MRKTFREVSRRIRIFITIFIIIALLYLTWFVTPYISYAQKTGIFAVLFYPTEGLVKTQNNSINAVVLGLPGGDYAGAFLTDSIQLISFNLKTKRITTISIPRDIWSEDMKDKINSAYFYGIEKHKNALYWLRPELQKITGIAPDYYVVVDFDKFRKLIDYMGGVDVLVEHSFVDKKFPVAGREDDECSGDLEYECRYETLRYDKGWEHMNGERALQFARSRNAKGDEGTDFAREKRQQKVMQAVVQKIIDPALVLSRNEFIDFVKFADKLFEKNISVSQLTAITRTYVLNRKAIKIMATSLPENLFEVPSYEEYEGRYVLVPKKGFDSVRSYVKKQLEAK